jgi:hypothetical protein
MPNLPCAAATRVARKKKGYGQQCNDCGVMRHGDILVAPVIENDGNL